MTAGVLHSIAGAWKGNVTWMGWNLFLAVIPVVIGEMEDTFAMWKALFDGGVFTNPVMPPAVPENQCRLRISLMATHTDDHIDAVLDAFAHVGRAIAVI